MGNKEERSNKASDGNVETTGRHRKSARPGKITYVPINDEDLAPYEPPVRKKPTAHLAIFRGDGRQLFHIAA